MRFTFLAAAAACGSLAVRPEMGRASVMANVGALSAEISSSPSDSLAALKAATGIVNDILVETGNATDHISSDDQSVLRSVLNLIDDTIYSSMDSSHNADVSALQGAVDSTAACNTDIAEKQSSTGLLGIMNKGVSEQQTELNRLRGVEDDKRQINTTKWQEFDNYMQMIQPPPVCPDFPSQRIQTHLDVYFQNSGYVQWYNAQKPAYDASRLAFTTANQDLLAAESAYNIHEATRDRAYCDYEQALTATCAAFDVCFSMASTHYTGTLRLQVQNDMDGRIQVKKAGDTLTHQIKFVLGDVNDQQTPPIDTGRYEITFPDLPARGLCDLSPLGDAMWVPAPDCSSNPAAGEAILQHIVAGVAAHGSFLVSQVGAVFQFIIGDDMLWVDLQNANGETRWGQYEADVTVTVADADFAALAAGQVDSMQLITEGKLQVEGDMLLLHNLAFLFYNVES